ncbi:hydrolase 76 protein [Agyrium rufum]|nr:hydrolase 76 protein [Agyrium rufum]
MHFSGRRTLWPAFGSLLLGQHVVQGIPLNIDDTDSIKQAASTVAWDMMTYYHGNESGQVPGLLPNPPYYWWESGAMFGLLIEYWYLTGDSTYNELVSEAIQFQVGYGNDFKPQNQTKDLGNDDQVFWAFTAMTAAELKFPDPATGSPSWLSLAQAVFNEQVGVWDTANCGGGLRWQIYPLNAGYTYKNTISTGGFFQLAARLARYTGNSTYADWANTAMDWLLYESPLISPNNNSWNVWDGTDLLKKCVDADHNIWTYNYGTLLSGSAFMYNYTNGNSTWSDRITGLLNGAEVFFVQNTSAQYAADATVKPAPNGQIMAEWGCELQTPQTCNYDQPSFKTYLARWMALTTQMAPYTAPIILPLLRASAIGAATQCVGQAAGAQPIGTVCGRRWYQDIWDGWYGVGEQMSALSVIQSNLITKVAPPVTATKGGTSKGDPSAGTGNTANGPGGSPGVTNPVLTETITNGDKAGAGILTALTLVLILGLTWWIIV